jgi:hypothetical protein
MEEEKKKVEGGHQNYGHKIKGEHSINNMI